MAEFSEKIKKMMSAIAAFFRSLWTEKGKPAFARVGKFFRSERLRTFGHNIACGKINLISISFLIALFVVFLSAVFMAFSSEGVSLTSVLYPDADDYFMDFFNSMSDSDFPNLYIEYHVIYAPIVYIPLNLVLHLIPGYEFLEKKEIRSTQIGMIFFFLVFAIALIGLAALLYKEKKGSPFEKVAFIFLMYFSVGMISVIDRGNLIVYAVFFSAMFLSLYKSEKWWVREISYVCLALAICLKIYPAFLVILLVRRKELTGALRLFVYWLVLFVTPFLYYGTMAENILAYLQSVFNFGFEAEKKTEVFTNGDIWWVEAAAGETTETVKEVLEQAVDGDTSFSFTGTLQILFAKFYQNPKTLEVAKPLGNVLLACCFLFSFFQDKDWKSATLLSICSITFTSSVYTYSLAFLIFPCLMFLNEANFKNPLHWIYAALFVGLFGMFTWEETFYHVLPIMPNLEANYYYYLNYANIIERVSLMILTFLLVCEGIFRTILLLEDFVVWIIRKVQRHKRRKASILNNPYGIRK